MMEVKFTRFTEKAKAPTQKYLEDACWDLYATNFKIDDLGNLEYSTGIGIEIPKGYVGLIFPRSSVCKKTLVLSNSVGVIDSGYTGEIKFKFKKIPFKGNFNGEKDLTYKEGDRVGQIMIIPRPYIKFVEVDELGVTDRGKGGFGSTGE